MIKNLCAVLIPSSSSDYRSCAVLQLKKRWIVKGRRTKLSNFYTDLLKLLQKFSLWIVSCTGMYFPIAQVARGQTCKGKTESVTDQSVLYQTDIPKKKPRWPLNEHVIRDITSIHWQNTAWMNLTAVCVELESLP